MLDKTRAQEIIQEMVRRIVQRFRPEKIVLFGSYARGTEGPDSDVDLLVVVPIESSRRQKVVEIYTLLAGMGMPKDIIVVTPTDVEKYKDVAGNIIGPALAEGKILYERTA